MFCLRNALRVSNEVLLSGKVLYHNNLQKYLRGYSIHTDYEIKFKPQLSPEENEKILNVLNSSSIDDLKRYKIPQNRIKNIKSWRNKKGAFQSLSDVLEVDGLSVKVLEKLCETIISHDSKELPLKPEDEDTTTKLNRRHLVSPPVIENLDRLSTVVALHVAPMGISWTRLSVTNHVDSWSFYGFSSLPKKMLPVDTFHVAVNIVDKLPAGDIYLLENPNNGSNSLQSGKTVLLSTQQFELTSMLVALINTSAKHNCNYQYNETKQMISNKVYFLKSKLSARLFGTLVGQERVSAVKIVTELLNNSSSNPTLPYSKVTLEEVLRMQFLAHTAVSKELLGQPLMLAITFMDICVKKNPASIKAVTFKGK